MKVYVASSWKNTRQPEVVTALRADGHRVYDFRWPDGAHRGFNWSDVADDWRQWSPAAYRHALQHPAAQAGFHRDMSALSDADATVLVLPCGRSAHLELGFAVAAGQKTLVLCDSTLDEPELMYLMASRICLTTNEIIEELARASTTK